MRWGAVVGILLLGLARPAAGGPDWRTLSDREAEREILARWERAGPSERRRMRQRMERVERARRFIDARPVVVEFEGGLVSVADLFALVLEPALRTPSIPEDDAGRELGLVELHLRALGALRDLRRAYSAPGPVGSGTLNLLLGYAYDCLIAPEFTPRVRLRFFTEVIRGVRELDGRAPPDARSRWLIRQRLLPALLGLASAGERDPRVREAVSEAASTFYLPSILDARAQARLAPLTRGTDSRRVLHRAYRQGGLDRVGLVALARSVAMEARDDPAFVSGAAPLLLELVHEPSLPGRDRAALLDVVLDRMAPSPPLRSTALDLLAAGLGLAPADLPALRKARADLGKSVPLPALPRRYRFLSVVLLQPDRRRPPSVARVVRVDATMHDLIRGKEGGFVGVLVESVEGDHADFLGPPPGLAGTRDIRLLRRTLKLERLAIETYGSRGEEIEVCVALPEDASEPVPVANASIPDVAALLRARLERTTDESERGEIIRLLVRLGTDDAIELAVAHARSAAAVRAILPLAEAGHPAAGRQVLQYLEAFKLEERERVLHAVLRDENAEIVALVVSLAEHPDPGVACLAADALLAHANVSGLRRLIRHPDVYARACACALAMRLTSLARGLRSMASEADVQLVGRELESAFGEKDPHWWRRLGKWVALAFRDPDEIERLRREHDKLELFGRTMMPFEYAEEWTHIVKAGKGRKYWMGLIHSLFQPNDPGRGIDADDLAPLLDALEPHTGRGSKWHRVWVEGLVALACAQQGMEDDAHWLEMAQTRLTKAAGGDAPPGTRRKPGVYWPIWLAARSAETADDPDRESGKK